MPPALHMQYMRWLVLTQPRSHCGCAAVVPLAAPSAKVGGAKGSSVGQTTADGTVTLDLEHDSEEAVHHNRGMGLPIAKQVGGGCSPVFGVFTPLGLVGFFSLRSIHFGKPRQGAGYRRARQRGRGG